MRSACAAALLLLAAAPAHAQPSDADRAEARRQFELGVAALERQSYPEALVAFQQSQALNPRPSVLFNIAMCQRELFDYPAAIDTLVRYLEQAGADEPERRRAEARAQITELETRVGVVVLNVRPDGARVLIDGREYGVTPLAVPLRLGPGPHVLELRREGYADLRRELVLAAGGRVELDTELVPVDPGPSPGPGPDPVPETTPVPAADLALDATPPEDDGSIVEAWWFWTLIGAAVVGAGVATAVVLWPADSIPADDWRVDGP